ncbi:MAG TPA: hypothetical protein VHP32_04715 [Ignavibacteria bacterium]|nr:hypothetical protein [Ignavibacteria bacterium]
MSKVTSNKELYKASKEYVKKYLIWRKKLRDFGDSCHYLSGNDNIIGRIGEMIVMRYYENRGIKLEKPPITNNPGYDLFNKNEKLYISVKTITDENKRGTGSGLGLNKKWTDLIIVEINATFKVNRVCIISKADFKSYNKRKHPVVDRKFFDKKELKKIIIPSFKLKTYL